MQLTPLGTLVPNPLKYSISNATSTPLGSGATFTGTAEDLSRFSNLIVTISGTTAAATGTLYFEFGNDGTTWPITVPVPVDDLTSFVPLPLVVVGKYFRVRYINGATAQTTFALNCLLFRTYPGDLTRFFSQDIKSGEPCKIVRAGIMGVLPDGETIQNVPISGYAEEQATTTPLGISGTYTSPWRSLDGYSGFNLEIFSDQVSADDGIVIEFTEDDPAGSPTVHGMVSTSYIQTSDLFKQYFPKVARGFRIVYTNGLVAQTSMILRVYLFEKPPGDAVSRLDTSITDASLASISQVIIKGKNPAGDYLSTPTNSIGYLHVIGEDFLREVSLGRVAGHSIEVKTARNDAVGGTEEDIWDPSSAHTYPTTAATVALVSSNANDTAAGTGVRQVRIYGLDATWAAIEEVVNLNGLTTVNSTNTFIRINKLVAETVGSGGIAAGTITATVGGNLQAQIPTGDTGSYGSFFTVPLGYVAMIVQANFSVGGADEMQIFLRSRDTTVANSPFKVRDNFILYGTALDRLMDAGAMYTAKTDIKISASRYGGGSGKVHVDYSILLIDETLV